MSDKIKKALPYLTINTIGSMLVLLCFFIEPLAKLGINGAFIAVMIFLTKPAALMAASILILAVNAAAFMKAEDNKTDAAILCSVLFGSLGGFIAAHTVNKSFEKTETINIIFNIHLWISAYLAISYMLYSCGYYSFSIWR